MYFPTIIKTADSLCYRFEIQSSIPMGYNAVYVDAQTGIVQKSINLNDAMNDGNEPLCPNTDEIQGTQQVEKMCTNCNPHSGDAVVSPYDNYQTFNASKRNYPFWPFQSIELWDCGRFAGILSPVAGALPQGFIKDPNGFWPINNPSVFGVSAYWGVGKTWEYFQNTYQRNGIDNNSMFIHIVTAFENSGSIFHKTSTVGSAPGGGLASDIRTAADVSTPDALAHEYTHGVIRFATNTSGSIQNSENGAIEEGVCDIFGQLVERYIRGNTDWIVGNQIPSFAGTNGKRNLQFPNLTPVNPQPDTYLGANWSASTDNHHRDGVMNKWFTLIANGGTHNNLIINQIGVDNAAKILYRTINVYFAQSDDFFTFRDKTIQATRDFYGWCSPEVREVTRAWEACGVGTTLYCAELGGNGRKGGALDCNNVAKTLTASNNLTGTVSYTWTYPAGTIKTNQTANQATFNNLQVPSTTISVLVNNASVSVSATRVLATKACRLASPKLGVEELSEVRIYPNPAQSQLHIEMPESKFSWQICSLKGEKLMEGTAQESKITINTAHLASSLYILNIQTETQVYNKKIELIK